MLPKQHRLTQKEDFRRAYSSRILFREGNLSLKMSKNDLPVSRIGFSVEKKYFKKAVERNRLKRILRELVQKNLTLIRPGFDIVIFCRQAPTENSDGQNESMQKLLRKSGLT